VFESCLRVRFNEVDSLGHVNNASYLTYLEQAAIDHATLVGIDMGRLRELGGVFVAHRHEIEFHRPAHAGDVLRIVTWLGQSRGATVVRHYFVLRDEDRRAAQSLAGAIVPFGAAPGRESMVVTACTEWAFVSKSGHPRRIPPQVQAAFASTP
jgi:YbgC/YbaW family acyl-CoA thioester hydrolase